MFQYLALTDGTTTCDLTDGISYALISYAPVVAPLRDNELGGGDGPYADVTEQITFHAIGCTAADAYAAARAVNDMLDQARRWWRGEGVTAIRLLIQAQGSTLDPLSVIIKGRAPGSPPNMALPATWNAQTQRYVIEGITIQFVRRGRLLSTTDTALVAAADVPTVLTATFSATHAQLSPLKVDFTGAEGVVETTMYIAITPASGQIIVEAETGAGGFFTSVADSANSARGGSVLRYTESGTFFEQTLITLAGLNTDARRFVTILTVRKNQTTSVFDISLTYRKAGNNLTTSDTQRISGSTTNPQLLIFNPASMRDAPDEIMLNVTAITASVGNTIDFDYVAVIQQDDPMSTILSVGPIGLAPDDTISVDPLVEEPTPRVERIDSSDDNLALPYTGDPGAFGIRGSQVQCALYATGGSGNLTRWRLYDTDGAAVVQLGLSLTRRYAYLVPE